MLFRSMFKAIVSQRLLASTDGGRVPAAEVLINTHHVAKLESNEKAARAMPGIAQQQQHRARHHRQQNRQDRQMRFKRILRPSGPSSIGLVWILILLS